MQRKTLLLALLALLAYAASDADAHANTLVSSLRASKSETRVATEARRVRQPGIRNLVFISGQVGGWRRYAQREVAVFKAGEAIQFYAEPVDLGWSQSGRTYRFEMRIDVEIRDADGHLVWAQKDFGHLSRENPAPDPEVYITGCIAVTGLAPGLYVLHLRFHDPRNSRRSDTAIAFGIHAEPRRIDI